MLLKIFKNRTVSSSGTWGTKNENNYEILNFEFPEELEEYNKRIVYYLGNQKVWDAIIDNKAILTNAITTKGSVKAYIWCTKSDEAFETDVDFRTQLFEMNFFENENADGIVPTEEQIDGFNTMLTAMNEKIEEIDELETTIKNAESQRQENEETRQNNEKTRQENEQTRQNQEAERERRTDKAIADIKDKTAEYNANAEAKTNEFNQNATQKTNEFNSNYTQKVNDFNTNASSKTSAFNSNAETKTNAFNTNAESKTSAFNDNATQKTTNFDNNASEKTDEFNTNAQNKIDEYDEHIVEYQAQIDELQEEVDELSENMPWNTTEQATEISVDDAAKYSRNKLELFGNTEQTQYTGKNLFSGWEEGQINSTTGQETTYQNRYRSKFIEILPNTDYFFSIARPSIFQPFWFSIYKYDENKNYLGYQRLKQDAPYTYSNIINIEDINVKFIRITEIASLEYLVDTQLESGTERTNYEPYVGGQPSPSLDYPQDIHVVTGNNTIHVLKPGEVVLPSNYTQLDYIESTGTQYIDTGINADSNKRVVMDMQYTDISNNNNTNMFAIRSTDTGVIRFHVMLNSIFSFFAGNSNVPVNQINVRDTNRHLFDFDVKNGKVILDNITQNFTVNDFDVQANIYLFARNGINTARYYNKSKVYKCSIYDNNILVRNFIPCKNPNNEIGLYDTVSKTFFANQGTGNFVAGNELLHPTYPVNLGSLELCKIGDYQDYLYKENGNWYVQKNTASTMLRKPTTGNLNTDYTYNYFSYKGEPAVIYPGTNIVCSHLVGAYDVTDLRTKAQYNNGIYWGSNTVFVRVDKFNTVEEYINALSTNDITIIGRARTPTTTQITDETLISQLDAIYEHLQLVKGTNNITVTAEDLAPYMKLSYMQDLPSKLDNLDSRLALLE